jgi:hypothetical protein
MSEWWTYRLSSFLLFSPRTYYRLFELYNAAIWPVQVLAVLLGLGLVALLLRGGPATSRWIAAAFSACWLWCALAFLAARYAKINWFATYVAWAFTAEAALLAGAAVLGRLSFEPPRDLAGRAGVSMCLVALIVLPLAGPLFGRGWRSAEVFGVAPDPTAVATAGALLLARARHKWLWMAIPALWCLTTGATLLAMKAPDFWVSPLGGLVAVAFAARRERAARA